MDLGLEYKCIFYSGDMKCSKRLFRGTVEPQSLGGRGILETS